jgi:PPM family protein phosphatase
MLTGFQVSVGILTDPGQKRKRNEDFATYFEPNEYHDIQKSGSLYIVADGVGGATHGDRASKFAAEKVLFEYYRHPNIEPGERLRQIIQEAGNEIFYSSENNGPMATTMTAAIIIGKYLIVANVGDSRVYLIRNNVARQITEDHTDTIKKNKLTRSLGGETNVRVDIFDHMQLQTGDIILLCSDGLHRYVPEQELPTFTTQGSSQAIAENLITVANDRGGTDNITAIIINVGEPTSIEELIAVERKHSSSGSLENRATEQIFIDRTAPIANQNGNIRKNNKIPPYIHVMIFIVISLCIISFGIFIRTIIIKDQTVYEEPSYLETIDQFNQKMNSNSLTLTALSIETKEFLDNIASPSPYESISEEGFPKDKPHFFCIVQVKKRGIGINIIYSIFELEDFPRIHRKCTEYDQETEQCLKISSDFNLDDQNDPIIHQGDWIIIPDIKPDKCVNGNGKWVEDISQELP